MKIQKGIVKYKDRNDIVCTYGVTDNGKQFYFLDENDDKKFANGNRIASTELVEAIDPMVKASHIGIVGANGNEVVPFIYKSIRPVNDSVVLLELAKPVSPSVLEATSLKSDPLSAAKLVSTPAAIKEKINAKMGPEGRYLFNDQFSEVTVCDIDGNNLVNDELYSFAGVSDGKLYLSKNTIDSEIVEFSLLPPEETAASNEINVSDINVSTDIVDKAMDEAANSSISDIPPIVTADESSDIDDDISEDFPNDDDDIDTDINEDVVEIPTVDENNVEDTSSDEVTLEKNDNIQVVPDEVSPIADAVEVVEDSNDTEDNIDFNDNVSEEIVENTTNTNIEDNKEDVVAVEDTSSEDEVEFTSSDDDDEVAISFSEPNTSSLPSVEDSLAENDDEFAIPDLDLSEDDLFNKNAGIVEETTDDNDVSYEDDLFNDTSYKVDNIETEDYYNDNYDRPYTNTNVGSDSIMSDVAKSLASLMKQNKNQKVIISDYKDKLDKIAASRRNIVEKAKIQEQKIEVLTNKNRSFENTIAKLEAKLQMLEGRVRDQDKLIAYQSKELESIKPQKDDLAKLVADAQALLGDDNNYSYYDNEA